MTTALPNPDTTNPLEQHEQDVFISMFLGDLLNVGLTPEWARGVLALPTLEKRVETVFYGIKARQHRALMDVWYNAFGKLTLLDLVTVLALCPETKLTPGGLVRA